MQPYRTLGAVPAADRARYTVVDGVPTDFSAMDARVGAAARNRLDILALVLETPAWAATDASNVFSPPRDDADYARFLRALIGRYGPSGTYWAANPGDHEAPAAPVADLERAEPAALLRGHARSPSRTCGCSAPRTAP